MSEAEAFSVYRAHVAGCRSCRSSLPLLCDEGVKLHESWRREASSEPPPKARPKRAKVVR
jgi:hypothetical protein